MDSSGAMRGSAQALASVGWRVGLLAALAVAGACTRNDPNQLIGTTSGASCDTTGSTGPSTSASSGGNTTTTSTSASSGGGGAGTGGAGTGGGGAGLPVGTVLDDRVVDYNEALRTASFKLVGNAPTLQQILDLKNATNQPAAYAAMIDQMMADSRFAMRMIAFWQNTMRQGGAASGQKPSRDAAPTFAARLVFEGRPYTDLFTATENTCPTFDGKMFVDGSCPNGPVTAGVLTDPGVHAQYFGNLAFRRNRFFQETFACRKQPAELGGMPKPVGNNGNTYTAPWPFESIAGTDNGGRVDFHDVSSAVCANCHATANHRAPLFANYDANGKYQTSIQVQVPVAGTPTAVMADWLPQTPTPEPTAWKFGVPAADIGQLGAAMAKDDEVIACGVRRMWNYVMSKGDIVIDASDVPDSVIAAFLTDFKANNYDLREVLRSMLVSPDFVRF
ncbi:MAG: DUF1549 domain-containing protein [Minicystis sp.]